MNFKNWLLNEEIFPNKTATVYHRTKSVKDVSSVLTSDYKVGKGCYYGCGLYTTFAIESQFTNYMKIYGKAVVKFKVTDLDKYLIFQLSVAKQIHGKDYKISSQLKKLGVSNKVTISVFDDDFDDDEGTLRYYDEQQEKEKYSATLAKDFYEKNKWIENSVKGIIYYGKNDGYCLLKYPTVQDGTITMWGYAVAEVDNQQKMEELKSNIGWIKSVGVLGTPIKNVYNAPEKIKGKFAFGDNKKIENIINIFLTSKNLEVTAKKLASELDKFSDENILSLLKSTTNKDQMVEVIIKYKKELTDQNVYNLVYHATDKDKIAELIIEKKPELSDDNIYYLLLKANDKGKIAERLQKETDNISKLSNLLIRDLIARATEKDEMLKIIIKYKPDLSDNNVESLLHYAIDKDKIAGLIGTDKINKLDDDFIYDLLHDAEDEDKDKMAKALGLFNIKKIDNDVNSLLDILNDKEKMKKMLEKYKAKKIKSQM